MKNTEDIGVKPAKDRDKALRIEINQVFDHLQHHSLESAMEMLQSGKLDGFASHGGTLQGYRKGVKTFRPAPNCS